MFGFVRLHEERPLTGAQVKWLGFQLSQALIYLHDKVKIAHRGKRSRIHSPGTTASIS